MTGFNQYQQMIETVALALGKDLLEQVAFVGGCTTGLLLTDPFTREQVRYTDDVDLIVSIVSHVEWVRFQALLRDKGFREDSSEGTVICRMVLNELKVDFMPAGDLLGFSNRWYPDALATAAPCALSGGTVIRLIQPVYFVATKLEAYQGRGNNDPMASHDIEDILNLFDGRSSLLTELQQADQNIRSYISEQLAALLKHSEFEYAVQATALGNRDREHVLFQRLEQAAKVQQL